MSDTAWVYLLCAVVWVLGWMMEAENKAAYYRGRSDERLMREQRERVER